MKQDVAPLGGRQITKFNPYKTKIKIAGLKAAIHRAAKIKDWATTDEGIDLLILEQGGFVTWWNRHVTPRRNGQLVTAPPVLAKLQEQCVSAEIATELTGISESQVCRWRRGLADPETYTTFLRKKLWKSAWANRTREDMHAEDEERVKGLKPIAGKFKTLVADPPWDYDWFSLAGRAKPGYATMTRDDLLGLDVQQWAEEDCHLYLWVTNNFMARGCELMEQWGFSHKTVLTWVKPHFGLGSYFRNQTEHVLFGVKGELRTRRDDIGTIIKASVGKHSEKPQEFYDLVAAASWLPAGELFQREARDGFTNVFVEALA